MTAKIQALKQSKQRGQTSSALNDSTDLKYQSLEESGFLDAAEYNDLDKND